MTKFSIYLFLCHVFLSFICETQGMESVWSVKFGQSATSYYTFPNYMNKGSYVWVQIDCQTLGKTVVEPQVQVHWVLQELQCMEDMYQAATQRQSVILGYIINLMKGVHPTQQTLHPSDNSGTVPIKFQASPPKFYRCNKQRTRLDLPDESEEPYYVGHIAKSALDQYPGSGSDLVVEVMNRTEHVSATQNMAHRVVDAWEDGMYHFLLAVSSHNLTFEATAHIQMRGERGFLPAISWPYLKLSGVMSLVYLMVGTVYVGIWAYSQTYTQRIHLVIGGVVMAGASWNTLMFVNLTVTNNVGNRLDGLYWLCEVLAAIQTSATYLILMFVSTGFGINRPKLSTTLIVVPLLICFFNFCASLAVLMINDEHLRIKYNYPFMGKVGYGLEALCLIITLGWIMVYSIMTFVHLYKRRHSGQRQFIAFCIFMATCVLTFLGGGVAMVLLQGVFTSCRTNWQWEWMSLAVREVLLLLLLCVLIALWKPVDEGQSYGFKPLNNSDDLRGVDMDDLDSDEDEVIMEVTQAEDGRTENIKLLPMT